MFEHRVGNESFDVPTKCVEEVSCCIVREYLSRKGLKDTLAQMDREFPRGEGCFTARDQLIRAGFMERLVRDNKAKDSPFRALLEMLIFERLQKKSGKPKRSQTANQARDMEAGSMHPEINNNKHISLSTKTLCKSDSSDSMDSLDAPAPATRTETGRPQSARGKREPGGFIARRPPRGDIESVHKLISKSQRYREPYRNASSAMQRMEEAVKRSSREPHRSANSAMQPMDVLKKPEILYDGEEDKPRVDRFLEKHTNALAGGTHSLIGRSPMHSGISARIMEPGTTANRRGPIDEPSEKSPQVHHPKSSAFPDLRSEISVDLEDGRTRAKLHGGEVSLAEKGKSFLLRSRSAPRLDTHQRKHRLADAAPVYQNGSTTDGIAARMGGNANDIEVSDLTDQDVCIDRFVVSHKLVNFRPITLEEAIDLKHLLFGTPSEKFGEEWVSQGFTFTKSNAVPYGLLQKKGGPCGVLAAVQAYMLKELLWPETSKATDFSNLEVDVPRRNAALARALALILWQAGDSQKAVVVNPSGVKVLHVEGLLAVDGITETLTLSTFTSKTALQDYYRSCIFKLQEENCSSCVAFLISVLITHGFERVRDEMDERNSCLIGKHNHCNQEVVNLLLVGKAVTNVFNNEVSLGKEEKTVLRGITSASNIGLLSLFEHYNSCQVGSYYKDPEYPIWIVLSESHFSVLFSKSRVALNPGKEIFDLYYYDGLNNQEEEIRLTVDPMAGVVDEDAAMTPPLELCIRTRWNGASVSWNEAEPLL